MRFRGREMNFQTLGKEMFTVSFEQVLQPEKAGEEGRANLMSICACWRNQCC